MAEAPGASEAEAGKPLVGTAGSWLRGRYDETRGAWSGGLLGRAGIRDADCTKLNVINCRPPDNVFPTSAEARSYISPEDALEVVNHCLNAHVWPVVRGRSYRRIILLGEKALRFLTGKTEGITIWRGSPLPLVGESEPSCIPTLHPAYIARSQYMLPAVISDLKKSLVIPPERYNTEVSLADLRAFDARRFAFDIETNMETGAITMIGLSAKPFEALCVPWGDAYRSELARIFRDAEEAIGHNCIQFDLPVLRDNGVALGPGVQVWDTMLMQHLLQPDLPHDLGFVGSLFTNKPAWKHLPSKHDGTRESSEELYNCRDTDATLQCWQQLRPLLASQELDSLYRLVQVPLARLCRSMYETGITLDPSRVGVVREKLKEEMRELEGSLPEQLRSCQVPVRKRVPAPAGTLGKSGKPVKFLLVEDTELSVPWRSPVVVAKWLYEELQLPEQLNVKTQRVSTDKLALDKLIRRTKNRPENAALQALRRLRVADEMVTTFAQEKLLSVQKLHPHFNVHGTASGRLSSSDPNLQNIPEAARYIYVPSHPEWRFLEMDFSSLENRLTAWFANDTERLARLSQPGFNEHKWVASQIFGIPYDEVEKDNSKDAPYGIAKRVGHGSNYGMGPRKIANLFDMDFGEVRKFSAEWRKLFAKTVAWQENCGKLAKEQGFLVTPFGRKRWFYTQNYYTEALSFLPQSTGADICYRTMLALFYERIGWPVELLEKIVRVYEPVPRPVQLVLQVHDSLLCEGPADQIEATAGLIARVAQQPWPELRGLVIPAEFKIGAPGDSWGELKSFQLGSL